jgi:hypothetical protein
MKYTKIIFSAIFLIITIQTLKGMKNTVVEKPYKPSFAAQYPTFTNLFQSSTISIGTYLFLRYSPLLITKFFPSLSCKLTSIKSALFAGSLTFLGTYFYNYWKIPHWLDSVLCDQPKALWYSSFINQVFQKAIPLI